ncbi:hypothetical protein SCP_0605870 [Sparassis crispa]|uniref:Uncharacterized protein n=1 Tax=Sparassis crispa TaxID=139825 RepID=A0A401GQV1_9APHY|nr:hypothetical protein SCP_0605870 [Sparassis crispa]GBE84608.1 hypothetical protein SCP_0605870 [Sparassis crispa]
MHQTAPVPLPSPPTGKLGRKKSQNEKSWYVILGSHEHRPMITQNEPFLSSGGKFKAKLPIVFKCPTKEQADDVFRYQPFLQSVAHLNNEELTRTICLSTSGSDILLNIRPLYPVFYGTKAAVYLTHPEAESATHGCTKPIWRKHDSFKEAIVYMLTGNPDAYGQIIAAHADQFNEPVFHSDNDSDGGSESAEPEVVSIWPPLAPRGLSPSPQTPSCRSATSRSHSSVTPSHTMPAPSTCHYAHRDNDVLSSQLHDHSISTPTTPAPPTQQGASHGTQIVHELSGVLTSHLPQATQTKQPVPSLGRYTDAYVQAYDFSLEAIMQMWHAITQNHSAHGCMNQLIAAGLSSKEVQLIWLLAQAEAPTSEWATQWIRYCRVLLLLSSVMRKDRVSVRLQLAQGETCPSLSERQQMAPGQHNATSVQRLTSKTCKVISRTPAEKKALAMRKKDRAQKYKDALANAQAILYEEATKLHMEFGSHSIEYYLKELIQVSQLHEVKHINDEAHLLEGSRYKLSDLIDQIKEGWDALSSEERIAVTDPWIKEFEECREMRQLAVQNVAINAFHDTKATLDIVQ